MSQHLPNEVCNRFWEIRLLTWKYLTKYITQMNGNTTMGSFCDLTMSHSEQTYDEVYIPIERK